MEKPKLFVKYDMSYGEDLCTKEERGHNKCWRQFNAWHEQEIKSLEDEISAWHSMIKT